MLVAPGGRVTCSVTGSSAPGADDTPWAPTAPERTTPSMVDPDRNVVTAVLPGCRSTTGRTSRAGPSGMARVAEPPLPSPTYPLPPNCDSPVQVDPGVTTAADPASCAPSACTVVEPTRSLTTAVRATARTSGF